MGNDVKMKAMETMNVKGIGFDYTVTNVNPVLGGEAFLFVSENTAFLYDSGFVFSGNQIVNNIKKILGDRPLDYVLLTHSHYDHALGAPYCAREWEDVKVVASRHASKVFEKDSAKKVMRELSAEAAKVNDVMEFEDLIDGLHVDIAVGEGDVLDLGDFVFTVHEYPGHTRCSIGFYCPGEKLLLSCETLGVYIGDGSMYPVYLVGYQMALDSIAKAIGLDIQYMLLPHTGMIFGDDCRMSLANAREMAISGAEEILKGYRAGKTPEELIEILRRDYYTDLIKTLQPEAAFLMNSRIMITMIIKELG